MRSRLTAVFASSLLCVLVLVAPADAAFPGRNGNIAFTRGTPDGADVYSVRPDGTGLQSLATGPEFQRAPAWSPDGTRLVWQQFPGLVVANPDGTDVADVPDLPELDSNDPTWSPDGRRLLFGNLAGVHPPVWTLYTVRLDGTGLTSLGHGTDPSWSPDGTRIALTQVGEFTGGHHVVVMAADGSNRTFLTPDRESWAPDWSPDGSRIAFTSFAAPAYHGVYVANANGSNSRLVVSGATRPAWAPDGSRIAFTSTRDDQVDLYAVNVDGTGETRITSGPEWDNDPSWQPLQGPRPSDYKNAAKFCKAERDFLEEEAFRQKYGGANAYGKCVSGK